MIICIVLPKGLKIAFVHVFERCNLISFAPIPNLAAGAWKKKASVQASKCSGAANCLARGLAGLAGFGFVWEMLTHFFSDSCS